MSTRSLWPREHGAYAQLGFPLATALALGTPTVSSIAIALAACLAFLANEPLLVVLGHRGARMQASHGERARRRLRRLAASAACIGTVGLEIAPFEAAIVAAVVAIPVLALIGLAWKRAMHSLGGEIVAAVALPGAATPVAIAAGADWRLAAMIWTAWSFGYACTVVGVHRVFARNRRATSWIDFALAGVLVAATSSFLLLARAHPSVVVAVPLSVVGVTLVVKPPRAARIRAVGVAIVIASLLSFGLTLALIAP